MNLVTPPTGFLAVPFLVWEYLFTRPTAGNLGGCMLEQELAPCGSIGLPRVSNSVEAEDTVFCCVLTMLPCICPPEMYVLIL